MWERCNWSAHAYCLTTNHYHLLVETLDANLAKGMRQLNGVYTQRFYRTCEGIGHVFQGRYKAIPVQKEAYLLRLARYVVLNPVRARMVPRAAHWPWSSYRAMVGEVAAPEWLQTRGILAAFGETEAVSHYVRFLAEGKRQPAPRERLQHQVFLGSDAFVEAMRRKVFAGRDLRKVPQAKARPPAKSLAEYARRHPQRDRAIAAAYAGGGYTMREDIGDYFGLHYSRVNKIVRAGGSAAQRQKERPDPFRF